MKRKRLKLVSVLVVLLGLSACVLLPNYVGQKQAGKYEPVSGGARPTAVARTPVGERQTEPHTCGLHATRSLYVAYGLDPSVYRLRFRLGTDEPAIRADKQSTGTLHPDLYRVLAQDGFSASAVDLDASNASSEIEEHLQEGQLALAVVYRGTYHWVLLGRSEDGGRLTVFDSLVDDPVVVSIDSFLDDSLSVTLVKPNHRDRQPDVSAAHADGLAEMRRLYQRR